MLQEYLYGMKATEERDLTGNGTEKRENKDEMREEKNQIQTAKKTGVDKKEGN